MKKSCIIFLVSLFSSFTGYSQKTYSEEQVIAVSKYIFELEQRDSTMNSMLLQIKNQEIASLNSTVEMLKKLIETYEKQVIELTELREKCDCDSLLAALEAKYLAIINKENLVGVKDIKNTGGLTAADVKFGVQIGAYRFPKRFSNKLKVKPLGEVEKTRLDDGITRFIIGGFNSIEDANEFRKRIIEKGVTDAFTVGIYNGKRMLISELRKQSLIPPLP